MRENEFESFDRLIYSCYNFGRPTSIKAELDTTRAYIGDPISWRIFVEAGKNERVEFPEINIVNELLDITSFKQITDQIQAGKLELNSRS